MPEHKELLNFKSSLESNRKKSSRLETIDTIRGFTIVSMVCFHFAWDLVYLFGLPIPWLHQNSGYYWQQSICWSFILIAGFCWSFGKKPFTKGCLLLAIGKVITLITVTFLPEDQIIFGVLTFIGSAMIFTWLFHPLLRRIPPVAGILVSFFLFLFVKPVNNHYLGYGFLRFRLPDALFKNDFTTWLGFPKAGFFSTDYFAILPWIFLFFTGFYLYGIYSRTLKSRAEEIACLHWEVPFFTWLGRKSIWVYVIHQPVLYGIYLIWSLFR